MNHEKNENKNKNKNNMEYIKKLDSILKSSEEKIRVSHELKKRVLELNKEIVIDDTLINYLTKLLENDEIDKKCVSYRLVFCLIIFNLYKFDGMTQMNFYNIMKREPRESFTFCIFHFPIEFAFYISKTGLLKSLPISTNKESLYKELIKAFERY